MSCCARRKGCVWILGKREPSWEPGGPACQEGEKAGSWHQTVVEKRRSKMAKDVGDGLATSSRDIYAQRVLYVHCAAILQYNHNRNCVLIVLFVSGNINHLVPFTICIHPLMYGKLCQAQ
jgi:hypothetical protein